MHVCKHRVVDRDRVTRVYVVHLWQRGYVGKLGRCRGDRMQGGRRVTLLVFLRQ